MAHVITSKQSHERAPRMARDAQFTWASGAKPYDGKPNATDKWGVAMVACAVTGSAAVIVAFIMGAL